MGLPPEPGPERVPAPLLADRVHLRCTWCRDRLLRAEGVFCAECLAPHHSECRAAHGRCAAPGCGSAHLLEPAERTRRNRRALRIAAGLALGVVAALSGASLNGAPRRGPLESPLPAETDPLRRGSLESPLPTHVSARTTVRLATDGFTHGCELAPGDRLLFRSWAGAREVIRIPAAPGPAEPLLVAPATAAIAVSQRGEAFGAVSADETCVLEVDGTTGWAAWRPARDEDLRRATRR